jgi:hypothetical protein
MARDYAKYSSGRKMPKKRGRLYVGVFAIFFVLVAGAASWFYINTNQGNTFSQRVAALVFTVKSFWVHQKVTQDKAISSQKSDAALLPVVHFDFYSELPKAQVEPPLFSQPQKVEKNKINQVVNREKEIKKEDVSSSSATPLVPATPQYLLQIGLFKNSNVASEERVSLLLSGIEGISVMKVTVKGETLYRLQQGPYSSMTEVKKMQERLSRKGIKSEVKLEGQA